MLVVHPSIPAKSVAEFVAYAKANPVSYAHGGNGSPGHLTMELFRMKAGFPATPDGICGRIRRRRMVQKKRLYRLHGRVT